MQRMLTVLALVGTATSATAESSDLGGFVVNQTSIGNQTGLNEIYRDGSAILNGDSGNSVLSTFSSIGQIGGGILNPDMTGAVDQSILNAVNLLLATEAVVENVDQTMLGNQIARNVLLATQTGSPFVTDQIGENIANIVIADQVDAVRQAFGPGATQSVYNEVTSPAADLAGVAQTGRNTANVVLATVSIGSGEQLFPSDTTQRIENMVGLDQAVNLHDEITQSGTNIGNVLIADEVRDVARIFSGTQIVLNTVTSQDGNTPVGINQRGLNIANFVSAKNVQGLTQVSDGRQIVENRIEGVTLKEMSENIAGYTHSSTNIVNLLEIQATDTPKSGGTINATQTANQSQTVQSNLGTHSQVGNAASISR